MAKIADNYLKLDPWKIMEEGWDASKSLVSESIFSLGNEYMGVRGYFEEGGATESLLGSYFNGIYEEEKSVNESAYKGIVQKTHYMVNSVDWLYARVFFEGERLDLGFSSIRNYRRTLDLRKGTVVREFDWLTSGGKVIGFAFTRFLDMQNPEQGFQKIEVIPRGFSGTVEVHIGNDFNTIHQGRKKCLWNEIRREFFSDGAAVLASTLTTGQRVFSGFTWKSNRSAVPSQKESDKAACLVFHLPVLDNEESRIEKKIYNLVEKDARVDSSVVWKAGSLGLKQQEDRLFEDAARDQEKYWESVWEQFDIRIDGDEKNQQGIRFCIFQMQQTYHGQNASNNIGAKGLTGESYNGHAFWDTETCCLPFYLFTNLKAAKNLLEFRYSTLPQALARAKQLDSRGACYPVATLNGEEACNLWQHASLQFQPSTAVAYGIAHYSRLSGDKAFLFGHGIEMLIQISRFLESRGAWSQTKNGFGFYAVMGPDEFHMMVNNNCYTNLMAKKTFEFTIETLSLMRSLAPVEYDEVIRKTGLTEKETTQFSMCADKMILLYDRATKLFEQHEGYYDLPHIDVDKIPITDFPLYHHWSYDRIYRTDMIKQPDVLMFMFLFDQEYTLEEKRANYEYYEPRTVHESSLSPFVHSIFASELGKHNEAFDFFGFATRMDLDNYNRNSGEGLHTTSIAAAWANIVYGFGGMRSDSEPLAFNPSLPAQWKGYEFRIVYRTSHISVTVTGDSVKIRFVDGTDRDILLKVYGKEYSLGKKGLIISLPEWRKG